GPVGDAAVEGLGPAEGQVQREIGPRDGLVPMAAARTKVYPLGRDRALHRAPPPAAHWAMREIACKARRSAAAPQRALAQDSMHPVQRRRPPPAASLSATTAQQTPRNREFHRFGRAIRPSGTLLRGPRQEASQ